MPRAEAASNCTWHRERAAAQQRVKDATEFHQINGQILLARQADLARAADLLKAAEEEVRAAAEQLASLKLTNDDAENPTVRDVSAFVT